MMRGTRDFRLPTGCIGAESLRTLANAIDGLDQYLGGLGGARSDRLCLRRVDVEYGEVVAHVSSGPDVGGVWMKLILTPYGWRHL
jgi:hypothetical protein